jgi:hypothetical protein
VVTIELWGGLPTSEAKGGFMPQEVFKQNLEKIIFPNPEDRENLLNSIFEDGEIKRKIRVLLNKPK